uniref:CCHC-type domain-containing protein n=1 Tax=Callorhinchus milii TaxID=7868 RepID=A0A4W3IJP8_CALMI
ESKGSYIRLGLRGDWGKDGCTGEVRGMLLTLSVRRDPLYYPEQPQACLRYGQVGHYVAACTQTVCWNCKRFGHLTKDCPMGKRRSKAAGDGGKTGHRTRRAATGKEVKRTAIGGGGHAAHGGKVSTWAGEYGIIFGQYLFRERHRFE